ncbi:MAG: hypothetical protein NVS4B11_27320 [Ktedonobacteraceae bacterium]
MSNEATSLLAYERCEYERTYETASTIQTIVSAMQHVAMTHVQQIALVTVTLQFESEGRDDKVPLSHHLLVQSTQYYLDVLRRLVRKTDVVYMLDSTFYFLLLGANIEGGSIVQSRLWDALLWRVHNVNERDILRPRAIAIGHAAYAAPHADDAHGCVVAASKPCYSFDVQPERGVRKASLRHGKELEQEVSVSDTKTVSLEQELTALARKLGVPYLSLLPRKKPEQVQRLITLKLVHELQCYPLGRERGTLTVALSNPQDSSILARLHKETGLRIFPVLAHPQELQTALSQLV